MEEQPRKALIASLAAECTGRGWRLAWSLLRHREDAADCVQQALMIAWRKAQRIPADDPWPWFAAVIAHEARNLRRRRARRATLPLGTEDAPMSADPLHALHQRERAATLAAALNELPHNEREALVLTQLGGLTYAQAAQALRVPLGTLNHRVSRAFATLRHRLREDDERAVARALVALPVLEPPAGFEAALASKVAAGSLVSASVVFGGIAMKKSTAVVAALVVALLLGMGGVAVLTWPDAKPADRIADTSAHPSSRQAEIFQAAATPAEPGEDATATAPQPAITRPAAPPEPTASPQVEAPTRRVLVATDHEGNPVSTDFVVDWRTDTDAPWATQSVRTDASGRAQLAAPIEAMVRISLAEFGKQWITGGAIGIHKAGTIEAHIKLYGFVPARVRVIYADGQPYSGLVMVRSDVLGQAGINMGTYGGGPPLPVGWPSEPKRGGVFYSFLEVIEFAGVAAGIDLTFETAPNRPGFMELKRTVTAAEFSSGGLIELVIPTGVSPNTPGKVVLVPPAGVTLEGHIRLMALEPNRQRIGRIWQTPYEVPGKPGTYEARLASDAVRAGRYVLYIVGKTPWFSGEFEIAPGETKELRPVPAAPASLRARVVDADGNPVARAVVSLEDRELPGRIQWRDTDLESRPFPGEAATNADGEAVLADLPTGEFRFEVHAIGYQPWSGMVILGAGQIHELGTIRLKRALGRVVVRLPDWDYTKRKLTWRLEDEHGRGLFGSGSVTSKEVVIDRLPVGRKYTFSTRIPTPEGARAFWFPRAFELTPEAPVKELDGTDQKWPADLD